MPSTTSWTRLEPWCRDAEMSDALHARIHDPLWALTRQWQVGEFTGEDAGSPVSARCRLEITSASRLHPGATGNEMEGSRVDLHEAPLEAVVEREPVDLGVDRFAAAEAGLHFLRLLRTQELSGYVDAYVDRYAMEPPAEELGDPDSRAVLGLVAGHVPDGARLLEDFEVLDRDPDGTPTALPSEPAIPDADGAAVAAVIGEWLDWFSELHGTTGPAGSWIDERMEHRFALSCRTGDGDGRVILEAAGYPGGHLDWHAFDAVTDDSQGDDQAADGPEEVVRTAIPAAVRYRGMPRSRWWEFEDARTDFGAVDAAPEDLASLLFVEFALVYGNDWFVLPVDVAVGSLCRIRSLVVTDTFGRRTLVLSHRAVDGADSPWRMFDLARSGSAGADEQLLFVPPTLSTSLHGPDLEDVLLRRDEMANLGWAIERTVASAIGTPIHRAEETSQEASRSDGSDSSDASGEAEFTYRLTTDVPDHWIPLVPVATGPATIRLRRGRMAGATAPQARGRVLQAEGLSLFEEEVPRCGARVTRGYQYARWIDGSTHLWLARRKRLRGGEAWSGLRFDVVEPTGE